MTWDPWNDGATKVFAFAGRFSYALPAGLTAAIFSPFTELATFNLDPVSVVPDHVSSATRTGRRSSSPAVRPREFRSTPASSLPTRTNSRWGSKVARAEPDGRSAGHLPPARQRDRGPAAISTGRAGDRAPPLRGHHAGLRRQVRQWRRPDVQWPHRQRRLGRVHADRARRAAGEARLQGHRAAGAEDRRRSPVGPGELRLFLAAGQLRRRRQPGRQRAVDSGAQRGLRLPALWHDGYGDPRPRPAASLPAGWLLGHARGACPSVLQAFAESGAPLNQLGYFNFNYDPLVYLVPRGTAGACPRTGARTSRSRIRSRSVP